MSGPQVRTVADAEEAGRVGADAIADALRRTLEGKRFATLALPGGRSVRPLLFSLRDVDVPWSRVHVFMADERWVPLDDKDSNYLLVKELLLDALVGSHRLPSGNVHPFRIDTGIDDYAAELSRFGGYDVVALSAGEDGHVAGLYPHGSIGLDSGPFIEITDSPKPPPHRMSASRGLLSMASFGALLFLGETKRAALDAFRDPGVTIDDCPAKIVSEMDGSIVLTDLS